MSDLPTHSDAENTNKDDAPSVVVQQEVEMDSEDPLLPSEEEKNEHWELTPVLAAYLRRCFEQRFTNAFMTEKLVNVELPANVTLKHHLDESIKKLIEEERLHKLKSMDAGMESALGFILKAVGPLAQVWQSMQASVQDLKRAENADSEELEDTTAVWKLLTSAITKPR